MQRRTRKRAPKVDPAAMGLSPVELFSQIVAAGIEEKPDLFLGLEGVVCLHVEGDRALAIRYGRSDEPLAWGADESAQLDIFTDRDGMGRIVNGTIDAEADLASGALRLEGDIDLIVPLFELVTRAQSMLSLRAGK